MQQQCCETENLFPGQAIIENHAVQQDMTHRNNLISQNSIINVRKHDFKLPAYKRGIQSLFDR